MNVVRACRFVDESIPWLIANGKKVRAEKILQKAARVSRKQIPFPVFDLSPENMELNANTKHTAPMSKHQLSYEQGLLAKSQNGAKDVIADDVTAAATCEDPHYEIWDIFRHRKIACYSVILYFVWCVTCRISNNFCSTS